MFGSVLAALLVLATQQCAAESPSIQFSPLPSISASISAPKDTSNGLGGFYDLAGGIVDAIRPGNLPHDTLAEVAATVSDHLGLNWGIPPTDTDIRGLVNEFLEWLAPVLAAMLVGVALAVAIPVVGCCLLCCRRCGRCGAKSRIYRKKNQNVKCVVFSGVFLVSTAMIFVGATVSAVSVRHTTESLRRLESTVDTALSDVSSYLDSGTKQVFFIADDQFDVFKAHVLNDMEHIGEWFEENVGSDFQSHALSVVNDASSFLAILRAIDDLLVAGNSLVGELRNDTLVLISRVSTLSSDMEALRNACTVHGLTDCQFPTAFSVTVDFEDISDIEFNEAVDFDSIDVQIGNATDIFRDIAEYIDTEAEQYGLSRRAEGEFLNAHSSLEYDYLNALNETVENMISDGGHIDSARSSVHNALKYLDNYEALWDGVALLLVSLFFLVITLFLIGLFCGSFGYSRVAHPHSRSTISNCGGRCLVVGVVIAFATSPVLLMTASSTLGLAAGVQKLCEDLQPPDYLVLKEVADDPTIWDGLTLVGLVTREETDATVNLSVYQSLSGCAGNEPLWKALGGDRLYSYYDFDDAFNCSSFGVGTEDFQPFDSFNSSDIFPYLSKVNDSFFEVDFHEFEQTINETEFLSFNLAELEANLTDVINFTPANTTVHDLATEIRNDLLDIEEAVRALRLLQGRVEGNITQLQNKIEQSESNLVVFTDDLHVLLDELQDVVGKATDEYINRLCGFVEEYIDYANETIRNEVGRCAVFPAAYGAVHSTVCDNALDGLNGYWLGVGWCMLFTLVAVVVGVVLSDYFRRAGTRVVWCDDTSSVSHSETASLVAHNEDDDDDDNVSLIHMRPKGRSYPSNTAALPEEQEPLHTTQMDMEW